MIPTPRCAAALAAGLLAIGALSAVPARAQRPLSPGPGFAPLPELSPAPGGPPGAPTGGPAGTRGYLRLRLVRVMDEHGFERPVEAYRFLAPVDWHVQTWLRWRPEIVHCPTKPIAQQQQRVQSGLAQQYSQYIRGVETCGDRISGERVELANGHARAWSNGRGGYILSHDTNFNPGVAFRERWEEMPRLKRSAR